MKLKDHPFAVEAFFESSLVLSYATEVENVLHLCPPCLYPDTFQEKWAFIAVAIVQTHHMRPKGFPKFMGQSFILTGYRLFVTYITSEGKRLRGLYILKSETDSKRMEFSGNLLTRYTYSTTDIDYQIINNQRSVQSKKSGINIVVEAGDESTPLPPTSPFANWKEARRFAGPLPFTFSFKKELNEVLIIEGVRDNWIPKPVKVLSDDNEALRDFNIKGLKLANAFIIENIPYYWKKGRIDQWHPQENPFREH